MSDKILYTGGPNPFKGLIGMPEPVDDCGNESTCECDKPGSHCHYVNTVESIKSNAPTIVNPELLPQWDLIGKGRLILPGDIFDLPIGYEFKECEYDDSGAYLVTKTGLRIVKTEVKDETQHCGGVWCPFEYSCVDGCMNPVKVKKPEPEESQEDLVYELQTMVRNNASGEQILKSFTIQRKK